MARSPDLLDFLEVPVANRRDVPDQISSPRSAPRAGTKLTPVMTAIALNQALRRVFWSYDQSFDADMLEALFYIRDFPGTTVSNLAQHLGYKHLSRATSLVDAMSNRGRLGNRAGGKPGKRQGGWGVIERRRKPEDRRFEQLFITPKGEEAAAGLAYAARRTWKRIEHLLERD